MIGLSVNTYDLNGALVLKESLLSSIPPLKRRVSRTATLDGKSSLTDLGFSYSDGTYIIIVDDMTEKDKNILLNMVKNYSLINLSSREGAFSGVMSSLILNKGPVQITFLIKEILNDPTI